MAGVPNYDFGHGQLRTLTYEETSLARRRLLHRRVAEATAARSDRRSGRGAPASQIAAHYRMSGEDSRAAQYFELAGQHARALFANAEALWHFRTTLEVGHPDALSLHEAIGDLQTLLGDYGPALTSYETADCPVWAKCAGAQAALHNNLADMLHASGRSDDAMAHLTQAVTIFAEIGVDSGALHPEIWKLVEW